MTCLNFSDLYSQRRAWLPLPYVVYGFLGVTSALLCCLLPETLGMQLCETVDEAEKHGL